MSDKIVEIYKKGDTGQSAYEAAVEAGFVGTKAQWVAAVEAARLDAEQSALEALSYKNASDANASQTELDRTAVRDDKNAADADVLLTHADVILTHADVVLTYADVLLTHADVTQTALDRVATGADRTQTGLDVVAVAASAASALISESSAAASALTASQLAQQLPKGTWNASTNVAIPGTVTLADGVGTVGWWYMVSVAGTSLGQTFAVGDEIFYNGATWVKITRVDYVGMTTNYLQKFNGTKLANSAIFESGGKVAIGTATADLTFNVVGRTALGAQSTQYLWYPSVGDNQLYLSSNTAPALGTGSTIALGGRYTSGNNTQIAWASIGGFKSNVSNSNGDGYMAFFTAKDTAGGSIERARITAAGNFSVGYSTEAFITNYKLSVNGSGYFAGNVAIGSLTSNTTTKLIVGDVNASRSDYAQIVINRNVDDTGEGTAHNAHAYSDSSTISRSGTVAYCSYDARVLFSGTNGYDHYAGFQAAPAITSSGTILNLFGFVYLPSVTAATVTNAQALCVYDPTGTGTVINNYGVYVAQLAKGSVLNYAIYTAGTTASYFGGAVRAASITLANLTSGKIPIATTNGQLIDGVTPLSGTKTYYVADSSGGAVNRKLTFNGGILTAES